MVIQGLHGKVGSGGRTSEQRQKYFTHSVNWKALRSPCCGYAVRRASARRNTWEDSSGPGYFWGSSAACTLEARAGSLGMNDPKASRDYELHKTRIQEIDLSLPIRVRRGSLSEQGTVRGFTPLGRPSTVRTSFRVLITAGEPFLFSRENGGVQFKQNTKVCSGRRYNVA